MSDDVKNSGEPAPLDPTVDCKFNDGNTFTVPRSSRPVTAFYSRNLAGQHQLMLIGNSIHGHHFCIAHVSFDPVILKLLAKDLQQAITNYEAKFGQITIDAEPEAQPPTFVVN